MLCAYSFYTSYKYLQKSKTSVSRLTIEIELNWKFNFIMFKTLSLYISLFFVVPEIHNETASCQKCFLRYSGSYPLSHT